MIFRVSPCIALLCSTSAALASALTAQAPSSAESQAFDRVDREARTFITTMRCAQRVSALRAQGLFGPADSAGGTGLCPIVAGRLVGVFMEIDTTFANPTRFAAVEIGTRTRWTAPLDTTAVLGMARAERHAQIRGSGAFERADRQYVPFSFRFDGDSIEVWIVPVSVLSGAPFSVGGERGYAYSPDGRALVREVDAFGDYRVIPVADTGVVRIRSTQEFVPTFSEMLVANLLNDVGRHVTIDSRRSSATLVGPGGRAMWIQVRQPH